MGIRRTVVIGAVTAAFLLGGPTAAGYDSELLSEPFLQSATQGNDPAHRLHQYLGEKTGAYFETKMGGKNYIVSATHICGDKGKTFHFMKLELYDASVVGSGFLEIPDTQKKARLKELEANVIFRKAYFGHLGDDKQLDSYIRDGEKQEITPAIDEMFGAVIEDIIGGKKK